MISTDLVRRIPTFLRCRHGDTIKRRPSTINRRRQSGAAQVSLQRSKSQGCTHEMEIGASLDLPAWGDNAACGLFNVPKPVETRGINRSSWRNGRRACWSGRCSRYREKLEMGVITRTRSVDWGRWRNGRRVRRRGNWSGRPWTAGERVFRAQLRNRHCLLPIDICCRRL